jgi:hypothetical protein
MWDDWMYANRSTYALTCEIYTNSSAWQNETGPEPDTLWERGVFQFFNPDAGNIEPVIQRWLPVFTYITNRAITEAYDVATTNIVTPKTVIGQGYSMDINITVANQGEFTETFNLTVYANTTAIQTKTLTLTRENSTTLTFTWNTTGFAKSNYTISGYAWPVQGETYTSDNTLTDGLVYVGVPGDVNGDHTVGIKDILIVAKAYGANPQSFNWNPNADVDCDGKVDVKDILITAKNYGKTDP